MMIPQSLCYRQSAKTFIRHCYLMIDSCSRLSPGILVIGGHPSSASNTVEFWSAANPEEGGCQLSNYPRYMDGGQTVNFVAGQLVACYENTCEIFNGGKWDHLVDTRSERTSHSSAVKESRILLIGGFGWDSSSTEWISVDGSPSQPGPFNVRHSWAHCTIQLSADLIVVTGGVETSDYVTEYQLTGDGNVTPLTPMVQGRWDHACGVYQGAGGQQVRRMLLALDNSNAQVLLVTGGYNSYYPGYFLSSTEVSFLSGKNLYW